MKKLLLIGKTGQLGRELFRDAPVFDFEVFGYTHHELDVTNAAAVESEVKRRGPDVIVNTAAFHVGSECEKNPLEAFKVNCIAVRNLAKIAKENGASLVTFSTDYVFDGESSVPYNEESQPNPIQIYGMSKTAGEYAALNTFPEGTYIIRTCGVYGGNTGSRSKEGNFVLHILRWFNENNRLEVSMEQFATPTFAKDLSEAALKLFKHPGAAPGIYHLVNEGHCSWYEFASSIVELAGLTGKEVVPVDRNGTEGGMRRPKFSVLENTRAKTLGIILPTWSDALGRYIKSTHE